MTLELRSAAFQDGMPIPVRYTGDGEDASPPLAWSSAPEGTQELALICEDPDAPRAEPFVHWVAFGISPHLMGLPENVGSESVQLEQGRNDFGKIGYGGPQPPEGHGVHDYHFKLYAIDRKLDLEPGATKAELLEAIGDSIIETAELVGTYERAGKGAGKKPAKGPRVVPRKPGTRPPRGGADRDRRTKP